VKKPQGGAAKTKRSGGQLQIWVQTKEKRKGKRALNQLGSGGEIH